MVLVRTVPRSAGALRLLPGRYRQPVRSGQWAIRALASSRSDGVGTILRSSEPALHGDPELIGTVGVGVVGAGDQLERDVREAGSEGGHRVCEAAERETVWFVRVDPFLAADGDQQRRLD